MKKLLLVIDMINDFCHPEGSLTIGTLHAEEFIQAVKNEVDAARNDKDPIIWLIDTHKKGDLELLRWKDHGMEGTWGNKVLESLRPNSNPNHNERPINKNRFNGFYNTDLEFWLGRLDLEEVRVVGCCTGICVSDTVAGLCCRDYNITVVDAATADLNQAAHEAALARMKANYGIEIV